MIAKTFLVPVEGAGSPMPVLAVRLEPENDADRHVLSLADSSDLLSKGVLLALLDTSSTRGGRFAFDPDDWVSEFYVPSSRPGLLGTLDRFSRALREAHRFLEHSFDELESGAVLRNR